MLSDSLQKESKGFYMENLTEEEWFSLDDITPSDNDETLYCISVDAPEKQFLIGDNIAVPTHNTEEGKADDALKGEAAMIIGSIARLGRAAGVHLVIATQRPDATTISGETKSNLGVRINCGRTDSTASSMILGSGEGTRVRSNPKGRLYLRIFGAGNHGQGFFAPQSWIDDWLQEQGKNPDGSPISAKRSRLANVADMSQFEEGDLDSREGVDNSSVIEQIRDEESSDEFEDLMNSDDDDVEFDWDEEDDTEEAPAQKHDDGKLGRPELNSKEKKEGNSWDRAEDSWDDFMEEITGQE